MTVHNPSQMNFFLMIRKITLCKSPSLIFSSFLEAETVNPFDKLLRAEVPNFSALAGQNGQMCDEGNTMKWKGE